MTDLRSDSDKSQSKQNSTTVDTTIQIDNTNETTPNTVLPNNPIISQPHNTNNQPSNNITTNYNPNYNNSNILSYTAQDNSNGNNPTIQSSELINDNLPKPPDYFSIPPPYTAVNELPTYEEAQRAKAAEIGVRDGDHGDLIDGGAQHIIPHHNFSNIPLNTPLDRPIHMIESNSSSEGDGRTHRNNSNTGFSRYQFLPFGFLLDTPSQHTTNVVGSSNPITVPTRDVIGSDTAFIVSFLVSFIFNWIGFLFAVCISQTLAGRCGALAGFGLSIVKWTFIVRHSLSVNTAEIGLWWFLIILGALLFCKGSIQYLQARPLASTLP